MTSAVSVQITNSTIHANGNYGVQVYAQNSGTQATVTIKNSIVTQHTTVGIYRNTNGSGTVSVTSTYSDVWGNPTNYSGTAAGMGSVSQNPNYVNAPSNRRSPPGPTRATRCSPSSSAGAWRRTRRPASTSSSPSARADQAARASRPARSATSS